jgi:(p)ppGpp synthase/HD superfamily hydrolase
MSVSSPIYSDVVQRALVWASQRHTEPRKGTDIPYITHPAHVAIILAGYGFGEPVLAAAILHDLLEDTETTADEIRREFGDQIADMVLELSEPRFPDRPRRETWARRKKAKLKMLREACAGALAIAAADRVHNTANILDDIARNGPRVWNRFNSSPEKILEFGRSVLAILRDRFPHPLTEEYARLHQQLEQAPKP